MGQELVGLSASVTVPIRGRKAAGKVVVSGCEFVAYSSQHIKAGQLVEVVAVTAYRTVEVKWHRWLNVTSWDR